MRVLIIFFLCCFSPAFAIGDMEKETFASEIATDEEIMQGPAVPFEPAIFKTVTILLGILILVGLTIWMIRRFSSIRMRGMNQMKQIKILESRPLSQKTMLYLLNVQGTHHLIAESQIEVRHLHAFQEETVDKDLL